VKLLPHLIFILVGVILGKCAQYGAVDAFAAEIGYNAASLVGVVPAIAVLYLFTLKFPQLRNFGSRRG
jgi:hypothetical protein